MNRPNYPEMTRAQREEFILPLWMEGESASAIAERMIGATRNAIIGAVHRSKQWRDFKASIPKGSNLKPIKKQPNKADKFTQPDRKPTPKMGSIKFSTPKQTRSARPKIGVPDFEPDNRLTREALHKLIHELRPPLPGTEPISLIQLPRRDYGICRFPVQGGYCGVECGEERYCDSHLPLMLNLGGASTPEEIAKARSRYAKNKATNLAKTYATVK